MREEPVMSCALEQGIEELSIGGNLAAHSAVEREWITEVFHSGNPLVELDPSHPFGGRGCRDSMSNPSV